MYSYLERLGAVTFHTRFLTGHSETDYELDCRSVFGDI